MQDASEQGKRDAKAEPPPLDALDPLLHPLLALDPFHCCSGGPQYETSHIGVDSVHCLARWSRHLVKDDTSCHIPMHAKNVWISARDPEVSLADHRLRARSVGATRAARGKAPGGIPLSLIHI